MESCRLQETNTGSIALNRKKGVLDPAGTKDRTDRCQKRWRRRPGIIAELSERFGVEFGPEHRVTIEQMIDKLDADAALDAAALVNTPENVSLTFDHKVDQVIQEIVDSNFDLYKRIADDRAFGDHRGVPE